MQLLPVVALPALLVLAARRSTQMFSIFCFILFVALLAISFAQPSVTMFYKGTKWASGYDSWVFPVAVAVLVSILAAWRAKRKPGIIALLVCLPVSFFVLLLGAWVA